MKDQISDATWQVFRQDLEECHGTDERPDRDALWLEAFRNGNGGLVGVASRYAEAVGAHGTGFYVADIPDWA